MKLISMVEYVIETHNKVEDSMDSEQMMFNYAKFLSMPLTLGMFVPTDEEGNVLEEPKTDYEPVAFWNAGCIDEEHNRLYGEYQEALSNVIFEGAESYKLDKLDNGFRIFINDVCVFNNISHNNKNIHDLLKHNLTITQSAITKYQI